jgi:putative ferrous iron transport protein C
MLLSDIRNYLKIRHSSSLFELSREFDVEAGALRDMLMILVKKGQVRICAKTPRCRTQCQQCSELVTEMYEWVGSTKYLP